MEKLKAKVISVLKWSEKYTKTDMVYLVSGGSWLGLGQIISLGIVFLTSLAFANLLPPETYGVYKFILSIVAIITIPTLTGMDSAVGRAVAQGFDASFFDGLKEKLRFGLLATLAGIIAGSYYFIHGNNIFGISFLIAAFCVPLWESFNLYTSLLNGKQLFNKYTKYYVLSQTFSFIIIVGTLFVSKNVVIILAAYFISNTIIRILFFYKIIKEIKLNSARDPNAISYGKHLSLLDIIGTFLGQFDKILIFHYLGAIELALYSVAIAPTEQIKGVLGNIYMLASPRFASQSKDVVKSNIFNKAIKLGIFVIIITLIYIFLAPAFYTILFPKYILAIKYSQILSISLLGVSIGSFLYTFLEAHGMKKELYQYNIISNILNLIILFPLVYYFGIMGAIISRIIMRYLFCILLAVLIKRNK